MMKTIEKFKRETIQKIEEKKLSTDNFMLWGEIFKEQDKYGNDYKPKKKLTLYGYIEICPNCSNKLSMKYLGRKCRASLLQDEDYYVKECICGYKYAYTTVVQEKQ